MTKDWQALTALTAGARMEIERVRMSETGIAIEGRFELPPLARLTGEDQIFVAAFVRCHGSIKQMEKFFGVSYPTIKNRLNRIGALLPFAEIEPESDEASQAPPAPTRAELLDRLARGEVSVQDVLTQLEKKR
jgi:hypothetical protein